jgi:hypothetical protein
VQISHDGLALVTYPSSLSINGVGVNKTAALCVLANWRMSEWDAIKHRAMVLFVAFLLRQKRYSFLEVQGQRRSALLIYILERNNPPLVSGFHCSTFTYLYLSSLTFVIFV